MSVELIMAATASAQIARAEFRRVRTADIAAQRIDVPVRDRRGKVVHRLVCGSGLDDERPYDFSGLIDCKLLSSRVTDNPRDAFGLERPGNRRAWDSRARFIEEEVAGAC